MVDIFRVAPTGDVLWLESAATLECAKVRIEELAARSPGEYLVLDQQTGNKHFIGPDGVERRGAVAERKV
jgi:hypothetical protein